MYNSFVKEIEELEKLGYCDEINVYTRGKNINKPQLVYKLGDKNYNSFKEALVEERNKQRKQILSNPIEYLERIKSAKNSILQNGVNEILTKNSLKGLEELQRDFIEELSKENEVER